MGQMGHTVHILYVNKIHRVSKKAKYRHEKKIMCGMNDFSSILVDLSLVILINYILIKKKVCKRRKNNTVLLL